MRAQSFVAALVLMSGLTAGAQTSSGPADEHAALPAGPGRELVIRVCSQCHSPDVVANQQLDPAGWKRLVDQMAGLGAAATDAEFDEIVHYLADAFPASK
ncbi:MAG: cytochrome c [Acidobacteria bacterium]|nr:cytochrome c [Acidobacteriota bacterium]